MEGPTEPSGLEPAVPGPGPEPRGGQQLEPALGGFFEALLDARQSRALVQRVQALIRLGQAGDRRGAPALLMALGDGDWIVRKYAASGLGRLALPESASALTALLADARPEVRRAAARALGRLPGDRLDTWRSALEDADWLVREAAIEALGRDESEPATGLLLDGLADPVWLNRHQALKALASRDGDRVTAALLAALRTDRELSPWLGPVLAERGEAALGGLLELLDDAPPWRALAVATALGRLDDDRARAALARLVGHPDAEIESAIAHQGAAMTAWLGRAVGAEDWMVRWHACKLLGRSGDPEGAPALLPALADARPEVRLAALEALGRLADPRAESALIRGLTDPSWHIRLGAVEALGTLETPGARAALVDALGDARSDVRQAARRLLQAQGPAVEEALAEGLLRRPESYDEIAWLLKALKPRPVDPKEAP